MVRYALSLMAKAAEQERSNHGWLVRVLRDDGMQLSIPAKMTSATLSAQSEAPRPEKQTASHGNCWKKDRRAGHRAFSKCHSRRLEGVVGGGRARSEEIEIRV